MNKFVLKNSETRFQKAETCFQNAGTRFQNAKTALSSNVFARNWMDSARKKACNLSSKSIPVLWIMYYKPGPKPNLCLLSLAFSHFE